MKPSLDAPALPPAVTGALTVATLAPALLIAAVVGLWPQAWLRITVALLAVAAVAVSTWYLCRRVPRRPSYPMQIEQISTPSAGAGLLAFYVTPCVIVFAAQPASRWLAAAALALIGIVGARSGAVLSANPLLVLMGVYTFHARVRQLGGPDAPAQNVIMLACKKRPCDSTSALENLIPVADGVYMHSAGQAA